MVLVVYLVCCCIIFYVYFFFRDNLLYIYLKFNMLVVIRQFCFEGIFWLSFFIFIQIFQFCGQFRGACDVKDIDYFYWSLLFVDLLKKQVQVFQRCNVDVLIRILMNKDVFMDWFRGYFKVIL